ITNTELCFVECSEENIINKLNVNKASDYDNISNKFLEGHKDKLLPALVYLIMNCIINSIFPDILKIAIIMPVHKGGDFAYYSNYRPISLLSNIPKLLEK